LWPADNQEPESACGVPPHATLTGVDHAL
jgi:hypothetical protein